METAAQEQQTPAHDELQKVAEAFEKAGYPFTVEELSKADKASFHIGFAKKRTTDIDPNGKKIVNDELVYTDPLVSVSFGKAALKNVLEDFKPASPARITPSKRKPAKRDHDVLLVFGDTQIDYRRIDNELIPIHDEAAMTALTQFAYDLQPNEHVNLGDTVDFASLSRFQKDSDHFYRTLGPSFQRVHDLYAQLRADNPQSKITEVDSNHHKRLIDFVLKYMPDAYNLRRPGDSQKYPVFSYPYLANLEHVGVDWVGGYGAAEYAYRDDLAFIHGEFAVSGGSTAAKLSKHNPDRNIVQGHKHSIESHYRTSRDGRYYGSFVVGALCKTTGEVPSYHSSVNEQGRPVHYQEDWQNGVMVIKDYGEGNYQFDQIPVRNGFIHYEGKVYDGNS